MQRHLTRDGCSISWIRVTDGVTVHLMERPNRSEPFNMSNCPREKPINAILTPQDSQHWAFASTAFRSFWQEKNINVKRSCNSLSLEFKQVTEAGTCRILFWDTGSSTTLLAILVLHSIHPPKNILNKNRSHNLINTQEQQELSPWTPILRTHTLYVNCCLSLVVLISVCLIKYQV